jgi:hypothetical protein
MVVVGVLIFTGYLMQAPQAAGGEMLRTVFCIVLILYGIYRFVLTDMQRRQRRREQ